MVFSHLHRSVGWRKAKDESSQFETSSCWWLINIGKAIGEFIEPPSLHSDLACLSRLSVSSVNRAFVRRAGKANTDLLGIAWRWPDSELGISCKIVSAAQFESCRSSADFKGLVDHFVGASDFEMPGVIHIVHADVNSRNGKYSSRLFEREIKSHDSASSLQVR